ncbi:hypothetical protein TNCV_3594891 [Trichonephila clavipes]|nr:hypothetical protein TNCV_3594891 [Trichonephila clavipes]
MSLQMFWLGGACSFFGWRICLLIILNSILLPGIYCRTKFVPLSEHDKWELKQREWNQGYRFFTSHGSAIDRRPPI